MGKNDGLWIGLTALAAGFTALASLSKEREPVGRGTRGDAETAVFTVLDNGAIRVAKTPTDLDQIALSTRILSATIIVPDDLSPQGLDMLRRLENLLANKSTEFKTLRYFRLDNPDEFNFISTVIADPVQIELSSDNDFVANSRDHETSNGKILVVRWKESAEGAGILSGNGITAGVYSNAKTFFDFLKTQQIDSVLIQIPQGGEGLLDLLLQESPSDIGIKDGQTPLSENLVETERILKTVADLRREAAPLVEEKRKILSIIENAEKQNAKIDIALMNELAEINNMLSEIGEKISALLASSTAESISFILDAKVSQA